MISFKSASGTGSGLKLRMLRRSCMASSTSLFMISSPLLICSAVMIPYLLILGAVLLEKFKTFSFDNLL